MSEINDLRNSLESIYGLEPQQAMERLVGIYRHAKSLQSALDEIGKEAKDRISDIMAETGQTDWNTQSGRCYVTRPSVRVTYDRKALDQLLANDPEIAEILSRSLGVSGTVRKRRILYISKQTRIHLDQVEGLGEFAELEVVLRDGQSASEGREIARELMEKLGIRDEDLIDRSYIDLLELGR